MDIRLPVASRLNRGVSDASTWYRYPSSNPKIEGKTIADNANKRTHTVNAAALSFDSDRLPPDEREKIGIPEDDRIVNRPTSPAIAISRGQRVGNGR